MSFSYSGNPGQSALDAVRFNVGDTDARRPQLQDGEVLYCLEQAGGDIQAASITACEAIIAQLSRLCDQSVGSVSKSFSQLLGNYKEVLGNLRRIASSSGGIPIIGGISHAANALPYHNPDYVRPQFTTRMRAPRHNGHVNNLWGEMPGATTQGDRDL